MQSSENNKQLIQWIRADAYCRHTGDTKNAIYARCQRGEWLLGNHYTKRSRKIWINVEAVNKWITKNQ